jgi:hypothetical protein
MFWIFYFISVVYCIWRMVRSYVKRHGNDVIGTTPGLETLAIIVMAPVLMIVDVTLTWIRLYSQAEKSRRNNSSL